MIRKTVILSAAAFILVFIYTGQSVQADWGVSFYGEVRSPRYASYGDRIRTEYRRGHQVDDWVERGSSSVTDSPVFPDGIRLAAWATQDEDDHDFALASAIYFFEIPSGARSVRVKIYYEGEADRGDFNGGITGRVWIRRADAGDDYAEYYPDEGRYEDVDQPLYGDTFVLRAKKHLEILRMSAADHVIDGMMELHVVAEGRQRIDVKYIEVETYSYMPSVRVVTRYYRDYTWRPWYDYTYWYFYTGPTYHFADSYYVRYTYPRYRHNYVSIRRRYNDYLRVYYIKHPRRHVRWTNVARVPRGANRSWDRDRLNRWTQEYEDARRSYVVTSGKRRKAADIQKSRVRIRSVLSSRNRVSPAMSRARSGVSSAAPSAQRKTVIETRGSGVTEMKRRSESSDPRRQQQYRSSSGVRTRTQTPESSRRTSTRVETPGRTRTSSSSPRSSVRTRNSSSQREPARSVQQSPSRSTPKSQTETKQRRQVIKARTETSKSGSKIKRTPPTPVKTKDDDDDDDDDKKKSKTTRKQVRKRTR